MPVLQPKESLPGADGPRLGDLPLGPEPGPPPSGAEPAPAEATEPTETEGSGPHAGPAVRSFRHHEVALGAGKLVLDRDGTIHRIEADGSVVGSWRPQDPEWPRFAIRFGLRPGKGRDNAVPGRAPRRERQPRP